MATIKDVVQLSGYSAATVSRVINSSGYVSEAARQTIERAMKKLDYAPSALAQNLSAGTAHAIGVIVPNVKQDYFVSLVNGIMTAALDAEQQLVLLPSIYDSQAEKEYLEQMKRHAYDGLIFISPALDLEQLVGYKDYGQLVVCQPVTDGQLNSVYVDRMQAYQQVFKWVKERGTDQIACLQSRTPDDSFTSWATDEAYRQVFHKSLTAELTYDEIWTYQDAYQAAEQLAGSEPQIDFILANGDDMVSGLRRYYLDHQLPMPVIIGQGTSVLDSALGIPRIDHHIDEVGKAAFRLAATTGKTTERVVIKSTFLPSWSIFINPNEK